MSEAYGHTVTYPECSRAPRSPYLIVDPIVAPDATVSTHFAPMAISTSSSQVGMGEAAGDGGMIWLVGWAEENSDPLLVVSVLSRLA